jgi:nitroreductase
MAGSRCRCDGAGVSEPDHEPVGLDEGETTVLDDAVGLYEGLCTTRAIRRYRADPIPEADLAKLLFAATRAPSGSNRQPFRFIVLRDGPKATKARVVLGEAFRAAWGTKREADQYDAGSGAKVDSPKARMAQTMQHYVDHFEEAPVVVLAAYRRHREPHVSEGASVYPACQNLLLAARALGYGGVMTMWHGFVEAELRSILEVPDDVVLAATITLGRPEGGHGPVRRRPLGELVYEDGWDEAAVWAVDPEGVAFTRAGPPRGDA